MTDEWTQFKERTKAAWSLGDYARVARLLEPVAEEIVDLCGVGPGMEILDVAAGTGNVAVAAARKGASVVASDLTPAMIELGKQRSASEGVSITWTEADAEDLPFENDSFDAVISVFGAIFAPHADRATRQMFRVAREGGVVGMAAWTPNSWSGNLFSLMAKFAPPPPPGTDPPALWGDPEVVRQRFEGFAERVDFKIGAVAFDFPSIEDANDFFDGTGALVAARQALPPETYEELKGELLAMCRRFNRAKDPRVLISNEYLLVVARKAGSG
ncbi:MAG: methyltransferase domain-containing protein [Actinomycetota bacterium]|nr:methyltransferase domain-containing protein [Actinomycetota bacterium]